MVNNHQSGANKALTRRPVLNHLFPPWEVQAEGIEYDIQINRGIVSGQTSQDNGRRIIAPAVEIEFSTGIARLSANGLSTPLFNAAMLSMHCVNHVRTQNLAFHNINVDCTGNLGRSRRTTCDRLVSWRFYHRRRSINDPDKGY